jgi:hypothetical protein
VKIAIVLSTAILFSSAALAQQNGRAQDGFYSGQPTDQTTGQVNGRVDGRGNKNEGISPAEGDATKQSLINKNAAEDRANDADAIDRSQRPSAVIVDPAR